MAILDLQGLSVEESNLFGGGGRRSRNSRRCGGGGASRLSLLLC